MATRKQSVKDVAFSCVLMLLMMASARGATSDGAGRPPFPLTIVNQIEDTSFTDSLAADSDLAYYPAGESLGPPDLQRLAKQVTWFALLIVMVCVLIIAYANKRNRTTRSQNGDLHVVETVTLGPRCYCDLLRVRGQFFVVARDASGLKNIRQVNSFSDTFAPTVDNSPLSEQPFEYEFAGNTFVNEGL